MLPRVYRGAESPKFRIRQRDGALWKGFCLNYGMVRKKHTKVKCSRMKLPLSKIEFVLIFWVIASALFRGLAYALVSARKRLHSTRVHVVSLHTSCPLTPPCTTAVLRPSSGFLARHVVWKAASVTFQRLCFFKPRPLRLDPPAM
jgi:hypothetical protein